MPVPCLRVCELSRCPVVRGGTSAWEGFAADVGRDVWPHAHFSLHGCHGAFNMTGSSGLLCLLAFPPVIELQALQAALQHGNTLAEHNCQLTHPGTLTPAW